MASSTKYCGRPQVGVRRQRVLRTIIYRLGRSFQEDRREEQCKSQLVTRNNGEAWGKRPFFSITVPSWASTWVHMCVGLDREAPEVVGWRTAATHHPSAYQAVSVNSAKF
jgi:hypothetical protein